MHNQFLHQQELEITVSALKTACKSAGIAHWPYNVSPLLLHTGSSAGGEVLREGQGREVGEGSRGGGGGGGDFNVEGGGGNVEDRSRARVDEGSGYRFERGEGNNRGSEGAEEGRGCSGNVSGNIAAAASVGGGEGDSCVGGDVSAVGSRQRKVLLRLLLRLCGLHCVLQWVLQCVLQCVCCSVSCFGGGCTCCYICVCCSVCDACSLNGSPYRSNSMMTLACSPDGFPFLFSFV